MKALKIRQFAVELRRRHVFRVAAVYAIVGWVLLQIGEVVFPALALPDWALTLLVVLVVFGFFPAIILAWAFDMTPEGVVRTEGGASRAAAAVEEAPSITTTSDDAAARLSTRELDPRGIAVLPFENMSPDPENEYFSDGVAEDLITRLYEIDALRVISRASAWQFKNARTGAREIAAQLGVAYLVDGSVRRSGQQVRIGAQLIDARTDGHIWSETYDRELEDIFAIQSDVADRISTALQARLFETTSSTGEGVSEVTLKRSGPSGATTDLEAYDLFLRGRHLWNRRTARDLSASVQKFETAIELDPEFALARAALAEAYVTLAIYGLRPAAEVLELARREAEEALRRDPRQASAMSASACVLAIHDWEWARAAAAFERAIAANPQHPTAPQWYATNLLIPLGRFDEALAQLGRARTVDPISPAIQASFGVVDFMRGDYSNALARFDRLVEDDPSLAFAHYYQGLSALYLGRPEPAVQSIERAQEAGGWSAEILSALGGALAASGRTTAAEDILRDLDNKSHAPYVSPVRVAQLHAALDQPEAALDRLEEALECRAADLIWVDRFPAFDTVRGHQRFVNIRERVFGEAGTAASAPS